MTRMTDHEQDLWSGCPIVGCYLKSPHHHSSGGVIEYLQYTPEVKIKLEATIPKGEIRMEDKADAIDKLVERLIPDDKFLLVVPDHMKAKIDSLFADYRRITQIDAEAKEIHDRICGPGMYIHEGGNPLGDLYHGVRDNIARELGELILDSHND